MKSAIIAILTIMSLSVYAQADRKFVRKGNGNYKDGKYHEAEVEYRKALEKDSTSFRAGYNLGNALYRQQQFDAAAGKYFSLIEKYTPGHTRHAERSRSTTGSNIPDHTERSRSTTGPPPPYTPDETLAKYYYNLGNTFYNVQKYKESIDAYKQSLRNNPTDVDAKHNLQMALKMMQKQQQQQQQQQQNKEGSNKDQQKNQQDQNQQSQQEKNRNEQGQEGNQQQNQQQADNEPRKGEISPEDAERILEALEHQEIEVMKEVQEKKERAGKVPVEKNW